MTSYGTRRKGETESGEPLLGMEGDGSLSAHQYDQDQRYKSYRSVEKAWESIETTFHVREVDPSVGQMNPWINKENLHSFEKRLKQQFERLWNHHHEWKDDGSGRRTFQDKISITQSLCNYLQVSRREKQQAVAFVANNDGRRFNQCGGVIAMSLGAIALARDNNISRYGDTINNPLEQRMARSEKFQEVCKRHNVDGWEACKKAKEISRETQ